MTDPAVSVIVPAFRAAAFIRDAVPRLQSQEFTDFEVIIVDDGSDDDTADAARSLADGHDRVRAIVLARNGGVAQARRAAVEQARGQYLWFIDADDGWPDDALRNLMDATRDRTVDIVVAGATFRYQDGTRRPLQPPDSPPVDAAAAFRMLLTGGITGHLWNKLFRRSVMAQASFTPARVQSDLIMVADALAAAGSVSFTSSSVYDYRLRSGSIITSTSRRAESLALIDAAVRADAVHLGLERTEEYRYFRARYIRLSGIKDALLASYGEHERAELLRSLRRELSFGDVVMFARRRDFRRFALAGTAKTSLPAHRALLRAADR